MLGIEWGKPIFIALVRESRFTKQLLEDSQEFTVNVPWGDTDNRILGFCGTKSGKDVDKFLELGLTPVESETIGVPGIAQLPLTLECKVLYSQQQDLSRIPADILTRYYPQDVDGTDPGKNRDFHIAYYAEVLNAYIIEE
jgi:flavin reductase (DIM6/NTAB) family NADH-FMN oxidoreductase RutF